MYEDLIGKTFGCMKPDRIELTRLKNGHTATVCYGHCIYCGSPMKRTISGMTLHPSKRCKNCIGIPQYAPPLDLTKDEFPGLVVLNMVGEFKGLTTLWRCRCKVCGKECVVDQRHIPVYASCGCLSEKERVRGREFGQTLYKNGTCYPSLLPTRRTNKNSSTGITGVGKGSQKAYRAYINLRGRQIGLGEYDTLAEAVAARKRGEEQYFAPEIEKFEAAGVKVKGHYQKKTKKKD